MTTFCIFKRKWICGLDKCEFSLLLNIFTSGFFKFKKSVLEYGIKLMCIYYKLFFFEDIEKLCMEKLQIT